ncbi:hypothetical protein [Hafnia paralvei]|uniref:hypothetical protein n=1 Tax=Hafnia paralvei TaxID=546367 RepID=UPI00300DAECC
MKTANLALTTANTILTSASNQDIAGDDYNDRVFDYLQKVKPSQISSELMDKLRSFANEDGSHPLLSDITAAIIYTDNKLKTSSSQEVQIYASATFDNLCCNVVEVNSIMNVMMNKMLNNDDSDEEE